MPSSAEDGKANNSDITSSIEYFMGTLLFSLVTNAVVLNPTSGMLTARVVMGPVYDTASFIPLIFSVKRHDVTGLQVCNAWCEVDIVRDK